MKQTKIIAQDAFTNEEFELSQDAYILFERAFRTMKDVDWNEFARKFPNESKHCVHPDFRNEILSF